MMKRPHQLTRVQLSIPKPVLRLVQSRARRLGLPVAAYMRRAVCNDLARVESPALPTW